MSSLESSYLCLLVLSCTGGRAERLDFLNCGLDEGLPGLELCTGYLRRYGCYSTEYSPAELRVVLVWFCVGPLRPAVSAVERDRSCRTVPVHVTNDLARQGIQGSFLSSGHQQGYSLYLHSARHSSPLTVVSQLLLPLQTLYNNNVLGLSLPAGPGLQVFGGQVGVVPAALLVPQLSNDELSPGGKWQQET